MAGLLDVLNSPGGRMGLGLLALGQQPRSQFAQGLNQLYAAQDSAKQQELQQQMMRAQLEQYDLQGRAAERKMALDERKQAMIGDLFGGGSSPLAGVQTGGGLAQPGGGATGGAPSAGAAQITQQLASNPSRIASLSIDQVAGLKQMGVDVESIWKMAQEGFKQDPGAYYKDPATGQVRYMPKLGEGMAVSNGQVMAAPGYAATNAGILGAATAAQEAARYPYTVGANAAQQNLAANLDPQKVYNPATQREEYVPRSQIAGGAQRMPPAQPMYQGGGYAGGSAQSAAAGQIETIRAEMNRLAPNDPERQYFERQLSRLGGTAQQAPAQVAPQAAPAVGGAYAAGPSATEAVANEAERLRRTEQVKADIKPTEARANAISGANDMLSVIDKIANHPGLSAATGLSGTLDPRNYIPGTSAKDFRVAMDQLQGKTFLQAFESLKGGGAITELEGRQAANSIARLNTAQSEPEFRSAVQDLRSIVSRSLARQQGNSAPSNTGGVTGSFAELPTANASNKGKFIRDTQTGKRLQSNGISWQEVQ